MVSFKESLIKEQSILLNQEASTWEEAVRIAANPLVNSGAIQERYVEAIIESTKRYGPYYVLMEGMAMPHARPEDGVYRNAFSLVTFKEGVPFSDGKLASVFVVLAATSSEIHTSIAIPQIVAVFDTPDIIAKLMNVTCEQEVLEIINQSDPSVYLK
ncbi:PTS sugar transporter subunit IIA [Mammaliicoccus lentus]|uniref:PTS sugar transporter subunit IIA n=1 Tax=Mammaliicoccus lentus TaxID=42858 RepID=UPI0010718867|nr:PTS sugar transporter subunit IIA [Mammaliicoccus lentus]MCR1873418.1 PTS sugar transporter subunit IIA [Mammaliicoccus lentus]TFV17582.1 PTS ascorbate transporter subunit IIA [Mammaliicoccus lentus]